MPVNKEALLRYRAINNLLRNHKVVSKERLVSVCSEAVGKEVAWRTIAGDLNVMRNDEQLGFYAPIKNIRNAGYCYTDKNYSIDQIPLQQEEITALSFAARLLQQYSNVDIFSTFSGAVDKLNQNLDLQLRNQEISNLGSFISFEKSTTDGGSAFIDILLQHIRQKTVVEIDYQSFSSQSRKFQVIHPYYLKEYRNRWYVLGYQENYQEIRTLALERMHEISPRYDISYQEVDFDISTFYDHTIGVSVMDAPVEKIELKVSKQQWLYLASQPLHTSQELISEKEDFVIIALEVVPNFELKSAILSMGMGVTVIKPQSLRTSIQQELSEILKQYQP